MHALDIEAVHNNIHERADFTLTDPEGRSCRFTALKLDVATPGLQPLFAIEPRILPVFRAAIRHGKASISFEISDEAAQRLRDLEREDIWELLFHQPNG